MTVPHYQLYVNGSWRDAATSLEVRSPATNELIATVAQGDLSTVDEAVEPMSWTRSPIVLPPEWTS